MGFVRAREELDGGYMGGPGSRPLVIIIRELFEVGGRICRVRKYAVRGMGGGGRRSSYFVKVHESWHFDCFRCPSPKRYLRLCARAEILELFEVMEYAVCARATPASTQRWGLRQLGHLLRAIYFR